MRTLAGLTLGLLLIGTTPLTRADEGTALLPPVYAIPFDDYDEAAMQAEMAAQVTAFLETMQRNHGRSEEALRNAVDGELEKEERGKLIYGRHLADHGILEGYEFRDGALVRGEYRCLQQPINHLNEFIGYYGAVKTALTSALGAPLQDETLWSNDLYQPLPDYWGVAVLIGHLRYAARWETPNGIISLELTGNRHSRLVIEYQSPEYLANKQQT
ncbi:hypothetical protein ACO9S2_17565 [Nitrospira sp. NS4]|uniref:hypothetical protein n=1 Tax=Nitrospira sp. NS4 TaxID=3414498 RepID=UPI003C2EB980